MSNQLTPFEQYIQLRTESELDTDNDNDVIGLMDSLQTAYQAEYDEINDLVCNALSPLKEINPDEHDLSDVAKSIYDQSTKALINEYCAVTAKTIRGFIEDVMAEVEYKILSQKEEVDGSYQAKQARELRLSQ